MEAAEVTLYRDVKLKNGDILKAGLKVEVRPSKSDAVCIVKAGPLEVTLRYSTVFRPPTLKQLEYWCFDAVAETPIGEETEPDGTDCYGFPAWPRILGVV